MPGWVSAAFGSAQAEEGQHCNDDDDQTDNVDDVVHGSELRRVGSCLLRWADTLVPTLPQQGHAACWKGSERFLDTHLAALGFDDAAPGLDGQPDWFARA